MKFTDDKARRVLLEIYYRQGMKYSEIIRFVVEHFYEKTFDPKLHRGHWSIYLNRGSGYENSIGLLKKFCAKDGKLWKLVKFPAPPYLADVDPEQLDEKRKEQLDQEVMHMITSGEIVQEKDKLLTLSLPDLKAKVMALEFDTFSLVREIEDMKEEIENIKLHSDEKKKLIEDFKNLQKGRKNLLKLKQSTAKELQKIKEEIF